MGYLLVVEPDSGLRRWLSMHLTTGGYEVKMAGDATDALMFVRGEAPEFALIATDLPGLSAYDLVNTLRSEPHTAGMPILFLAPEGDAGGVARAASVLPGRVMTKPPGRETLLKAVEACLERGKPSRVPDINRRADLTHVSSEPDLAIKSIAPATAPPLVAVPPADGPVRPVGAAALSMELKSVSLLVVTLRNLISMARALRARSLDAMVQRFLTLAREAILAEGGWAVRVEAAGLVAVFETSPQEKRNHAFLAMDAALQVVVASRRAKQWAELTLHEPLTPNLSVGCGVHSGEVIVARLPFDGRVTASLVGVTADIASRLNGRAKGLGWGVVASETAARLAGSRFEFGRRATITDTDHDLTLSILECVGYSPGSDMPEGLAFTAEVREAVLANTVIAKLAGDIDPMSADRTIVGNVGRMQEIAPDLPERMVDRRLGHGRFVTTFQARHIPSGRKEAVKTLPMNPARAKLIEEYLEAYRRIADLNCAEMVVVHEVGRGRDAAYVATEMLTGESLADRIRQRVSVGVALSLLSQICRALEALHQIQIAHGQLRAGHFLFRDVNAVVMADFNISNRIAATLDAGEGKSRDATPQSAHQAQVRADLRSVGLILLAMLSRDNEVMENALADRLLLADDSQLPMQLSSVQPLLDGLLGLEGSKPFDDANAVNVELSKLNNIWNRPAYPKD
jgi:class 3 adenylate cyclase/CheY-like chemotaxis protein